MNQQAVIITIGDELLIGQTIDTNSAWIATQLNAIGIDVQRRVAVGDTREEIQCVLDEELERSTLIFMTGGLGPTADDITKPVLCDYFGGKMVVNEEVLAHVKGIFERRKRPMLERNLKQAEVPDVCKVIYNNVGTAPGMWFEKDGKVVISMPGVPFEMKSMMEQSVLPAIRERYASGDTIIHRNIITMGEGESFIAEKIVDLEEALPAHIRLAYLPSPYMVKLRLTGRSKNRELLEQEVNQHFEALAERLDNLVMATEDLPAEKIAGMALRAKGKTIGLAESCTGGYIAHKLTQIDGSSAYFKGCIVSYATEIKSNVLHIDHGLIQEYGVVSELTAVAMAEAAAKVLRADIGVGVTGILSDSPYEDHSPVGTLFIAVTDRKNALTKRYQLYYDRILNKETAGQMALYMIWKFASEMA